MEAVISLHVPAPISEEIKTPAVTAEAPVTPLSLFAVPDVDDDEDDNPPFRKNSTFDEPNVALQALLVAYEKEGKNHMHSFFKDKRYFCGGPIPISQLYSEKSVDLVLSTDFCTGVDMCYEMTKNVRTPRGYDDDLIEYDIYLVLNAMKEVKKCGVPKPFQAGIMLLYFKFCKGLVVPESGKKGRDLSHILKDYTSLEAG